MRTPIIIISIIVLLLSTAFVVRFVLDKNPLEPKATLKKNESKKNESKKSDSPAGEPEKFGVTIVNRWDVPEILKEISGHEYIGDQRFACVQDELGKIFIYNTSTEKIEKEIPFASAGDYEGLALNGTTAYVLRADGQIFEVGNYNSGKPEVKQHKTHLTQKQDTEGMAFDKANNRLLISVKGKEPESDDYKGIYAFDLTSKEMKREPVFKIDLLNDLFASSNSGKSKKVKKKKSGALNPSEIAIHPTSGEIYITDGSDPRLLIMDKKGVITSLIKLEDSAFSQPEGISFSPTGKLYISNEGTKKAGNILEVSLK